LKSVNGEVTADARGSDESRNDSWPAHSMRSSR